MAFVSPSTRAVLLIWEKGEGNKTPTYRDHGGAPIEVAEHLLVVSKIPHLRPKSF